MYNDELKNTAISEIDSDYLNHFGTLGMRWGFRRYQPYPKGHVGGKEVGEAAKKAKARLKKEVANAKSKRLEKDVKKKVKVEDIGSRDISKLSDDELKQATEILQNKIKRVDAEKKFSDLQKEYESKTKSDRSKKNADFLNRVSNDIKEVTYQNAKDMFRQAEKSGMAKIINDMMDDKLNDQETYEEAKRREISSKYIDPEETISKLMKKEGSLTPEETEKIKQYKDDPIEYLNKEIEAQKDSIDKEIKIDKYRNPELYKHKKNKWESVKANNSKK